MHMKVFHMKSDIDAYFLKLADKNAYNCGILINACNIIVAYSYVITYTCIYACNIVRHGTCLPTNFSLIFESLLKPEI